MDDDSFWEGSLEEPEIVWFGGSARPPQPPAQPPQAAPEQATGNSNNRGGGGVLDGDPSRALLPAAPGLLLQDGSRSSSSSRSTGSIGSSSISAAERPAPLPTPATHAYLGEATTGSTLSRKDLEVGSTVELPILSLPGVVLFPGESLPLRLHNPAYAALAQSMLGGGDGGRGGGRGEQAETARHLGVVNRLNSRRGGLLVRTSPVGTTAEIRSGHGGTVGEDAEGLGVAVMARGRHRFRLVEDLGWRRGVRYWKVVISPDLCPGPLCAPLPRPFRDRCGSRHWAMATPRFVVDANSPGGLAARAASLLREQRQPLPIGTATPSSEAEAEAVVPAGEEVGEPSEDAGDGARRVASSVAAGEEAVNVAEGATTGTRSGGGAGGRVADAEGGAAAATAAAAAEVGTAVVGEGGQSDAGVPQMARPARRLPRRGRDGAGKGRGHEEEGGEEGVEGKDWMPEQTEKLDPTLFSFWLAANLPLDDDARQELLMLDSVVMRLRLEVKHLEQSKRRALCCAGCGSGVAWEGDVFTLPGAEGVVGAYVNPEGYVHQTVTVRDARNIILRGPPEAEHSWFPGYAWTTAYCARCPGQGHLGWRFTAVNNGTRASFSSPPAPSSADIAGGVLSPSRSRGGSGGGVDSSSVSGTGRMGGGLIRADSDLGPVAFYGLRRASLVHDRENRRDEQQLLGTGSVSIRQSMG